MILAATAAAMALATASPSPAAQPENTVQAASAWIAAHLPPRYDERLSGTTNTFTATYVPNGCTLRVSVQTGWRFNSLGGSDRASAYSVKGDTRSGRTLTVNDDGATLDFAAIDPSSTRVSRVDQYMGTLRVRAHRFTFTFPTQAQAHAMLAEMNALIAACAGSK